MVLLFAALVIGRWCCLLASREDVCNCSDVCEELKSVRLLGFVSWVCCPLLLSQGGCGACFCVVKLKAALCI